MELPRHPAQSSRGPKMQRRRHAGTGNLHLAAARIENQCMNCRVQPRYAADSLADD